VRVRDEAESIRPQQDSRDDEAGQRGQLEPVEDENDQQGARENDRQVAQDVQLFHGFA